MEHEHEIEPDGHIWRTYPIRITHGQLAAVDSAILPEETQQLEDVRDIGVAIAVDIAAIVCSKGTDRLQDVVHVASAITVEVAIAASDAFDDAIEGILGEIVPDPLWPLGVSRGSIMTTPLTSIVLVTVATIASGPGAVSYTHLTLPTKA